MGGESSSLNYFYVVTNKMGGGPRLKFSYFKSKDHPINHSILYYSRKLILGHVKLSKIFYLHYALIKLFCSIQFNGIHQLILALLIRVQQMNSK